MSTEKKRDILVGGYHKEAYSQAIVEGMVDPKQSSWREFMKRTRRISRGKKLGLSQIEASEGKIALLFAYPRDREDVLEEYFDPKINRPLIPMTFTEQMAITPKVYSEREKIAKNLERMIIEALKNDYVRVEHTSSRAKTDESISRKKSLQGKRKRELPLFDLYGVRVVVNSEDEGLFVHRVIGRTFFSPAKYPWGVADLIRYEIKDKDDPEKFAYKARHYRVMFGGRGMQQLAEIQLMTLEEFEIANASREKYELRYGKKSRSLFEQ